jgi:hypothetical protein
MAQLNFTAALEYYQKSLMLRSYFIKENEGTNLSNVLPLNCID